MTISGGCQCGAVRYRATGFGRASICHCRMCQKAFGSFYGPLVTAHELVWTRGTPKRFASSDKVRRGFCEDCGTPLTFEYPSAIDVAIGSLDDPRLAPPVIQLNPNDKLDFVDTLHALPMRRDGDEPKVDAFKASLTNFQHPDHDTAEWPVRSAR